MTEEGILNLYRNVLHKEGCDECPSKDDITFFPSLMNRAPSKQVMLIFESPGGKGDKNEDDSDLKESKLRNAKAELDRRKAIRGCKESVERARYITTEQIEAVIKLSRESFHYYWMVGRQRSFFQRFFSTLAERGVIKLDIADMDFYIKEGAEARGYWNDFFVVDAALCHVHSNTKGKAVSECRGFLERQLRMFEDAPRPSVRPKLLVVPFGVPALSSITQALRKRYTDLPENEKTSLKITECHGCMVKCNNLFILPLVHPSAHRMTFDCYFDYLREGLRSFL